MRHAPAHSQAAHAAHTVPAAQAARSAQAFAARRESYTPRTFAEATNIADIVAERRRLKRSLMIMRAFIILLVAAALIVGGFPVVWQYQSAAQLAGTSGQAASQVAGWPYPRAKEALAAARAYNKRLAKSGQPILGEAVDPFSAHEGASQAKGEDSAASKDKEYQSLLNADHEIMGAIRIPKISVDLPIWHGTSEEALASGAGHLYGSSLPVGGKSTHSVITGHRGLVSAMMFTRLDEMQKGDFFYIEVMGETLGYEVDQISVIEPDDTSQLRIVPGEDRVTLMTCTPYGVNTQRLLVSGHREPIPVPAPDPNDVYDAKTLTIMTVVIGILAGWLMVAVVRRVRYMPWRVMCHANSVPRRP